MRAFSAAGNPPPRRGAALSPAPGAGDASTAAPSSRAQASARGRRLLVVAHEDRSGTPWRLDVAVVPRQHHLEGGGRGALIDDDVDEIREGCLVVPPDHGAHAVGHVAVLGNVLVPHLPTRLL